MNADMVQFETDRNQTSVHRGRSDVQSAAVQPVLDVWVV